MPSDPQPQFRGIMAPQEGPFQQYLRPYQPRPIDAPSEGASGWESAPVAAGELALDFLKGVRKQRLADFLEQDKNTETQLQNYRQKVADIVNNPESDLTPAGLEAVSQKGHDTLAAHGQYELRDAKDGTAGVFRKIFTALTGGPIKTREPINWATANGDIELLQKNPEYSKSAWRQKASTQLAAIPNVTTAAEAQRQAAVIARNLDLERHLGPQGAAQWVANATAIYPADPAQEAMQRIMAARARQMEGGSNVPTTAPPPTQIADRGIMNVLDPGAVTSPPPVGPNVRPADMGAAVAPSAAPPAFDLRNPVDRMMAAQYMGIKLGDPETVYDPASQGRRAVANVVRDPFRNNILVNASTWEALPPEQQTWVPSSQYKPSPLADNEVNYDVRRTADGKTFVVRMRANTEGRYSPVEIAGQPPINLSGYEIIGPTQPPVWAGPGTGTLMPRGEAMGSSAPTPLPTPPSPDAARRSRIEFASQKLIGTAPREFANDKAKLRDWVYSQPNVDPEVRAQALKDIGAPPAADKKDEFMEKWFGGGAAGSPSTTSRTPQTPAPPVAQTPSQRNRAQ